MAENDDEGITVVPLPASDSQAEHDRIRISNDRDQALERDRKPSRHNDGYDEVADLKMPAIGRAGISPQDPASMPRAEDDQATFDNSPEFHDRPNPGPAQRAR